MDDKRNTELKKGKRRIKELTECERVKRFALLQIRDYKENY